MPSKGVISPTKACIFLLGFLAGVFVSLNVFPPHMSFVRWSAPKGTELLAAAPKRPVLGNQGVRGPDSISTQVDQPKEVVNAPPVVAAGVTSFPPICSNTQSMPEGPRSWAMQTAADHDPAATPCHWTNMTHWALKYRGVEPIKICTHDPSVDTVISAHLHKWGFWAAPDVFLQMLDSGPCTAERPYMLDIGANLGLFTLMGAQQNCRVLAFEPL
jgi:hypothetical protein